MSGDAIDEIKAWMARNGIKQAQLAPCFGTRARVSEVLNRKRGLSKSMIRNLNEKYGLPLSLLMDAASIEKDGTK